MKLDSAPAATIGETNHSLIRKENCEFALASGPKILLHDRSSGLRLWVLIWGHYGPFYVFRGSWQYLRTSGRKCHNKTCVLHFTNSVCISRTRSPPCSITIPFGVLKLLPTCPVFPVFRSHFLGLTTLCDPALRKTR